MAQMTQDASFGPVFPSRAPILLLVIVVVVEVVVVVVVVVGVVVDGDVVVDVLLF